MDMQSALLRLVSKPNGFNYVTAFVASSSFTENVSLTKGVDDDISFPPNALKYIFFFEFEVL